MWQDKAEVARYFTLVVGIGFLFAGITAFIPALSQPVPPSAPQLTLSASYVRMWGLFPVNALHNAYHLVIAVLAFLAFRSQTAARSFYRLAGISLSVLTVMGMIPVLNTGFGFFPLYGNDIWLHAVEAVIALYLGFFIPFPAAAPRPA